jgi:uncharacterized 2Fe-2S/4Fe-4S cluster protein (DUF4445 family)
MASNDPEFRVTFHPSGRSVFVIGGTTVLEAAAYAGLVLQTPCGGGATCGKCRVRIRAGRTDTAASSHRLDAAALADGWRLACATRIAGDAQVEVPAESMFEQAHQILVDDAGHALSVVSSVAATAVSLAPPSHTDSCPDLERLSAALGTALQPAPSLYATLPKRLRAAGWRVRAVHEGGRLLDVLPIEGAGDVLGVAFDLGTTTVVGTLLDLATGAERGVASTMNGQIPFGDDVLTRILRVREDAGGLADLQAAAAHSLNEIIAALCRQADVPSDRIYSVTLAGNTTMQQLVAGIDPSALGELPFVPVFASGFEASAATLGLNVNPAARIYLFPQVGGFVGGDTVAGMLAAGFDRLERPTLLVDIGTNGEIVLFTGREILCASTAAGPAFEGARIVQGMRATAGAIEKVLVRDGDVHVHTIGHVAPVGLCGTALIDAVAEMLRHGVMDETGRILPADEQPVGLAPGLRRRIVFAGENGRFVLAEGKDGRETVSLCQHDIRELQLASGAIRAGIDTLLLRAGLAPEQLDAVLLAGGFGNFIRRNNAQRIGLLPPLPHDRIRFIGNASSMGAKMALLSTRERARAEALRKQAVHVDLSMDTNFQSAFGMAMIFPDSEPTAPGSV